MAQAAQRLARLVQQLLSLARTGEDAQGQALGERVALTDVLQEAASACLDDALARRVDLGFEPRPAEVQGSAWMLRELLVNLVGNAIVHTPPGTTVTVSCGPHGEGGAFLEVVDDGPGVPEADRRRVFDRFVRLSSREGTGLGLAIVREIAEHHGATVRLNDGPGGQGLAVRVEFPSCNLPLPGSSAN